MVAPAVPRVSMPVRTNFSTLLIRTVTVPALAWITPPTSTHCQPFGGICNGSETPSTVVPRLTWIVPSGVNVTRNCSVNETSANT